MDVTKLVTLYFDMGLLQRDILSTLAKEVRDILSTLAKEHGIIISRRTLQRLLKEMKLCRRQYSDIGDVVSFIQEELKGTGKLNGYRWMHQKCVSKGFKVRRDDIRMIMSVLDSEGVRLRRGRRIRRREYFSKGPNFIWHIDGYDKLMPFGFGIHGCVDGFSRKIIWLNVYKTNSDPTIVGMYFVDVVEKLGGYPKFVRADHGTENVLVKQCQVVLNGSRHSFLEGTSTGNQRIESLWGHLRRQCVQLYLNLFHTIQDEGSFTGNHVDRNILLFCFTHILQDQLDEFSRLWNNHVIRRSKNDKVPYGRPEVIYNIPSLYNTQDFLQLLNDEQGTDLEICKDACQERKAIPCDGVIYKLCTIIMSEEGYEWPNNYRESAELYILLRERIMELLTNPLNA